MKQANSSARFTFLRVVSLSLSLIVMARCQRFAFRGGGGNYLVLRTLPGTPFRLVELSDEQSFREPEENFASSNGTEPPARPGTPAEGVLRSETWAVELGHYPGVGSPRKKGAASRKNVKFLRGFRWPKISMRPTRTGRNFEFLTKPPAGRSSSRSSVVRKMRSDCGCPERLRRNPDARGPTLKIHQIPLKIIHVCF